MTNPAFAPRLLPTPQAAHYLGVSATTLRGLPIRRKVLGGKRVYDRLDLDTFADNLATEGCEKTETVNELDALF